MFTVVLEIEWTP